MTTRQARAIEQNPSRSLVGDDQIEVLVRLASDLTAHPLDMTPGEIVTLARVAGSEGAFLEVAGVIAGFNFITRMADSMGVDPEIPAWVRRSRTMRRLALKLMTFGVRTAVDLRPRRYPDDQVERELRLLGESHQHLGLG